MQENIITLKNITKTYNGIPAIHDMHLEVKKGTVHALLGENGAGKSTLIKVLSGAIVPDCGIITFDGREYACLDPKMAIDLGIGVVYQEFNLVPYLSVADNVFLGNEPVKRGMLDKEKYYALTDEILASLGLEMDSSSQVSVLSVAYQQLVEIAKTVSKNVKLLVLDEPTAALSEQEVSTLFKLIKRLRKQGISIIYISHRLEELFEIADEVTVIRDGEYIDTLSVGSCTPKELITKMVGRELGKHYPKGHYAQKEVALRVRNLHNEFVKDINFDLHKGEILGFGGLVGAGRTELARAVFGADDYSGDIEVMGKKVSIASPKDAIGVGIALMTEDRKSQGLIMKQNIRENISISGLKGLIKRWPGIDKKRECEIGEHYTEQLSIKITGLEQSVSELSGGNQQKVVLAKWLLTQSRIIIFDEPTRGIDVGVKQEIYQLMKDLSKKGVSIIMISSEMPELIGVSDRILVMCDGRITGELPGTCTQEEILALATNSDKRPEMKRSEKDEKTEQRYI